MVKKITALLIVLFSLSQAFAYKAVGSSLGTSFVGHSVMETRTQCLDISVAKDDALILGLELETAREIVSTDLFSSLFGYVRTSLSLGCNFEKEDSSLMVKTGLSLFSFTSGLYQATADFVIIPSALLFEGKSFSFHAGLPLSLRLSGHGIHVGTSCTLTCVLQDGRGGR